MAEKTKRTWRYYYLMVIGAGLALSFTMSILGKLGIIEPMRGSPIIERPRFDNNACLNRYQEKYRRADPLIPDETLFSDVARACVVERSESEGW